MCRRTGEAVTAGFLFDVPVRFDTDYLEVDLVGFRAGAIPKIPLVEMQAMRDDPAGAARSSSTRGVTTLCRCWRSRAATARVLGFTDHDHDLVLDGADLPRRHGLRRHARCDAALGLAVDGSRSPARCARDAPDRSRSRRRPLRRRGDRGLWSTGASRRCALLMRTGARRGARARARPSPPSCAGSPHALNQASGRLYHRSCDADLGDARCGVDLDDPAFAAPARSTVADGIVGFAASASTLSPTAGSAGRLTWTAAPMRRSRSR